MEEVVRLNGAGYFNADEATQVRYSSQHFTRVQKVTRSTVHKVTSKKLVRTSVYPVGCEIELHGIVRHESASFTSNSSTVDTFTPEVGGHRQNN